MAIMNMATMPLRPRHLWIVFVSSLGQLIGTGVATLAGVIIPMLNIVLHPELSVLMQGVLGCIDLVGIVIGSVLFGQLSDRYGYLLFFRLCPALVLTFSLIAVFVPDVTVLTVSLFFIGLGIGGEYSLDSDYISELLPVKYRSIMIGVAKTGSAFGNIVVAGICWLLIRDWRNAEMWPRLMWIVAGIATVMLVCRIWFWESPTWLVTHGRYAAAERAVKHFLGPDVEISEEVKSSSSPMKSSFFGFIKRNAKQVIFSGIPWACEGLGVYGIGVFLPILIMALGIGNSLTDARPIMHVASSVETTFWISCIILPGFIIGIWRLAKKAYAPGLQTIGFWICAVSLVTLLLAFRYGWSRWISIISFMVFELFLNLGPHLVTYVLPPRIYPVADRGFGTGIAAALGKVGAVMAVFFIPMLLHAGGVTLVLTVSAAVMAAGALVTQLFAPKVLPREKDKTLSASEQR